MSEFHHVLSVPVEEDLLPLSALLHRHGVVHRIFEEGGRQIVAVERQAQVEQVRALYRAWRAGSVSIELPPQGPPEVRSLRAIEWRSAPVTLLLIVTSVLGFALIYFQVSMRWVNLLSFTPLQLHSDQTSFAAMGGQYWRLVTPAFLHFSWLHIVFNCLWLWEIGARMERVIGQVNMLLLFLVIAMVSNVSQFVFGGSGLFGGMSGVVYGLLGFSWVAPLLQPAWPIKPPSGVMLVMVGWLLLCLAGVVELLGFGAVANAAHIGGLMCGAVLGALFGAMARSGGDSHSRRQV
jgi:GlpG protein